MSVINGLDSKMSIPKINFYEKLGDINYYDIKNAFQKGSGPNIFVSQLKDDAGNNAFGLFYPGTQTINLDFDLINNVENGVKGAAEMLQVTVEHETAHFLDDQDGMDYPNEEGVCYEKSIYGHEISTYDDAFNTVH